MAQTPKVGRKVINAKMKAGKAKDKAVGQMFGGASTASDHNRGLKTAQKTTKKVFKANKEAFKAIRKNPTSGLKEQIGKKMEKNSTARIEAVAKAKRGYVGKTKMGAKSFTKNDPKRGK
jgi:hypothetical protein